jgi:hypothetical protein
MFIAVRLALRTQMIQALLLGVPDYPHVRRREHSRGALIDHEGLAGDG